MAIREDIENYIENNDDLANSDEATTTIRVTKFNDSSIDMLYIVLHDLQDGTIFVK